MTKIKSTFGWIVVSKNSNAPIDRINKPYGMMSIFSKREFAKQSVCWSPEQTKTYQKYYRTARIKISEV